MLQPECVRLGAAERGAVLVTVGRLEAVALWLVLQRWGYSVGVKVIGSLWGRVGVRVSVRARA